MTQTDLSTSIDIETSASHLWSLLCDLDHYRDWNPWVRAARGQLVKGGLLQLVVTPPDADAETIEAHVERVAPVSHLVLRYDWPDVSGRSTRHEFRLEPVPTGTRLHQVHQVVEVGVDGRPEPFTDRTVLAIEMMNAALKARAER